MNIVDSSLWLEYFAGTLNNSAVVGVIENSTNQYVPSICVYEVYKKMLIDEDAPAAIASTTFMQNATVVNITAQIATLAAELGKKHKLPMADSIIYATAEIYNAEIYTQDEHFKGLKRVHYFGK